MFDYHIHSTFSPDSSQTLEQICKRAIDIGLSQIAITDHSEKFDPKIVGWDFDYKGYSNEIEKAVSTYGNRISILKGVEIGLQKHILDNWNDFFLNHKFDFIIGSVHCADNCDIGFQEFRNGRTQKEVYLTYLQELHYTVKNYTEYSVIGHLDLVVRYGAYNEKFLNYHDHEDILDDILQTIIYNGKGIEVNTSGFRYGLGCAHPNKDILRRYKELGGQIITVGSDSHKVQDIGYNIRETYELLKGLGFKFVTTFKDLKPQFNKL